MSERPVESRIGQHCNLCSQVDDHPRHTIFDGGSLTDHHFDCGAADGCQVCADTLDKAPKDARHGQALIKHLTKGM